MARGRDICNTLKAIRKQIADANGIAYSPEECHFTGECKGTCPKCELPVSDLFSTILAKIQVLMLQNDIEALQNDPNFSIEASNGVYIVFLIIGIIGYFTIPTVAGWIIQAGGGIGNYNRNVNTAGSLGGSIAGATAGNVAGRAGRLIKSGFKKI